jgi:hypothetical protein
MATEFKNLNANKLFKIAKLKLKGRTKEWFKKLNPTLMDWRKMHTWIMQKYDNIDVDGI